MSEAVAFEFLEESSWFYKGNGSNGVTSGKFAGSTCIFSNTNY